MSFAAGLCIGLAVGGALIVILRQAARGRLQPNATLATAIGVVALVLAIIALARSGHDTTTATSNTSATSATTTAPASSTTSAPASVDVPPLVGLPKDAALAQLASRGLAAQVETIALSSVPAGFVVSQTPLPQSSVAPGTTVVINVSAAA